MAASVVHMPTLYTAWDPLPSLLTWFLMIPKTAKSIAMTTTVIIQANTASMEPTKLPRTPPIDNKAAMKANACDWVKDECASQSIGRVRTSFAERGAINCRHYISRFIANSFWRAVVLVGGDGRNIENAVTKGPERD